MSPHRMLLRAVEVDGTTTDVAVVDGVVAAMGASAATREVDEVVDGHGGALLPGLHDHHIHILALAAARTSVDCGTDLSGIADAVGDGWVRGINYHEEVAGDLDRHVLDRLAPTRPVRVQHRSGALWVLNSPALDLVAAALDDSSDVERGPGGEPNGRLWRYDERLRATLPPDPPDLDALGRELAGYGVTGVTDATPDLDPTALGHLTTLPQHVTALGAPTHPAELPAGLGRGPRKLLLRDHDLPTYDALAARIGEIHAAGRAVAVHCVTRESLVLTLAVLDDVGTVAGDRIEHAAVVPEGVAEWMARLRVAVVTQPDFLRTRGANYCRDVHPDDLPHLYPFASLLAAGVRTCASSDAPYGSVDPWQVIASAAHRDLGADERVPPATALRSYLSAPLDPGGPARRVAPGAPADLVLLHVPLAQALAAPGADLVRQAWIDGRTHSIH